jgi:hypothetical protein
VIEKLRAISLIDRSPPASWARIARRVLSESAPNAASSGFEW